MRKKDYYEKKIEWLKSHEALRDLYIQRTKLEIRYLEAKTGKQALELMKQMGLQLKQKEKEGGE